MDDLATKPVLFIVPVYNSAVSSGRWQKIGTRPLEEHLLNLPLLFVQDGLNPDLYSLYDPNSGSINPTAKQSCVGLERAAVWEAEHIESRIEDYYAGRPNVWVEQMGLS